MRILHYFSDDNPLVSQYVSTLAEQMNRGIENHAVNNIGQALTLLKGSSYDILHLHGCWRTSEQKVVREAFRHGVRLVLTPHGQLEPWVIQENYWKEKLPKQLYFQKRLVHQAYVVIIQGRMEQECMERLGWNPRLLIIRNSLVTHSISHTEMAKQMADVYQKVMDSNPLQLMNDELRATLRTLLMAGITGDRRWVVNEKPIPQLSTLAWRYLLLYAHQENIEETVKRGINILRLDVPDIDVSHADYFLPRGYVPSSTIESAIGNSFTSENERLIATFRHLRKIIFKRQLTIAHLVELDRELRQHHSLESMLKEQLTDHKLIKTARRLMCMMNEKTGLTEGFMPVEPLDDRITKSMRNQIENHLKI